MAKLSSLSFDALAPLPLARFWAAALRWEAEQVGDDALLVPTDDTGFTIRFVRADAPKLGQNRVHFDLTTGSIDDQQQTVEQLLALGARHLDIGQGAEETHVVLADPEGNELCIIEPTNNFLATCPRLGAVNCDGTRALGYFWSEALGWPLVWDQNEETAIRQPDRAGPKVTWSGPPLMPRLEENRIRFDISPAPDGSQRAEVERLLTLGATVIEGERPNGAIAMADPDGNRFDVTAG